MKRAKELLAASAFVGLTLMRLLFPHLGDGMREKLQSVLVRDGGIIAVFRDHGKKCENGANVGQLTAASSIISETVERPGTRFVSYYIEDGDARGEAQQTEQDEDAMPAAVAAFLERQTAFSDYTLPNNVTYSYTALPFEFSLPVYGRSSSGFGYRVHPILDTVRFHYGTDIAANAGETIAAFSDGIVTFAGYDESYGWHLKIDHGNGWMTHYCHCSTLFVREGENVKKGERVALVGATGLATGPHLHFELTKDGVFLNPEYYLNS